MDITGPAAWLTLYFLLLHINSSVKEKYSKEGSNHISNFRPKFPRIPSGELGQRCRGLHAPVGSEKPFRVLLPAFEASYVQGAATIPRCE
jgi:hypothetical protein